MQRPSPRSQNSSGAQAPSASAGGTGAVYCEVAHRPVGAAFRIATPLYFPRGSLGRYGPELPRYSRVTDFLDPWEGGWWRLRDHCQGHERLRQGFQRCHLRY